MSFVFKNAEQLEALCTEHNMSIADVVIAYEQEVNDLTEEQITDRTRDVLAVMGKAILDGKNSPQQSESGMVTGDAYTLDQRIQKGDVEMIMSDIAVEAMVWSMATNESNACSTCIVACPTAGSAGIVPASLYAVRKRFKLDREVMVRGLLNTSAIGLIVAENASVSGAEGGCQAEDGTAAAMAASAITEMRGGSVEACLNAAAMALKNVLGLVCDPIGGLVEVPCVKRTTFMVMNAFTASDLAMAGIRSKVPFDQVVDAMRRIGDEMPSTLRETAQGGLATTDVGMQVKEEMEERRAQKERGE